MIDIPYVPRQIIEDYISANFYDESGCIDAPVLEKYLNAITCHNFNDRDAIICFLLEWPVAETDNALCLLDAENQRDARAIWASEQHHYDNQRND